MAKYTVFFRAHNKDFTADSFIPTQDPHFHNELQQAAQMLSTTGKIEGFRSGRLDTGKWSIWLEDENGDRHNFILFISQFELSIAEQVKSATPPRTKQLVIIDPGGPRDSIGGQHPGYWSIDNYAALLDPIIRDYFMGVISEILNHVESKNYDNNSDGSITIHVNRPDVGYGIQIHCLAKFI